MPTIDGVQLHARRRRVLRLHDKGYTPNTIAEILSLPSYTVCRDLWHWQLKPRRVPTVKPTPLELFLTTCPRWVSIPYITESVFGPDHYETNRRRVYNLLHYSGKFVSVRVRHWNRWLLTSRLPMTLEEAKEFIRLGVPFGDVFPLVSEQSDLREWFVREPGLPNLSARNRVPVLAASSARVCVCGGALVRTGTCETCQSCGNNSGCG